jgi:hypothetical protein
MVYHIHRQSNKIVLCYFVYGENTMTTKIAETKDEAWNIQETYKGKPHGWIQWKGTDVCMDIYCACGHHSHIDAEFAYYVECPKCHKVYMCNGHIELIELKIKPDHCVVMDKDC